MLLLTPHRLQYESDAVNEQTTEYCNRKNLFRLVLTPPLERVFTLSGDSIMRITDLLAGDGYIIINKHLAKDIGLNETILLGELASEYNYWCDRGELIDGWFYSTIENVEEQTTLSGYQQRMALKHLEDIGLVRVERKGTPAKRYLYLDIKALNNKLLKNLTTGSEKNKEQEVEKLYGNNNKEKIINNNNNKKERKKSGYDAILADVTDDSLRELYREYIKMRKLIKAPMTDRALKMLINRVNDLEPNSINRQKKMIETAIMNNWKSVYPLKDDQCKKKESYFGEEDDAEFLKILEANTL